MKKESKSCLPVVRSSQAGILLVVLACIWGSSFILMKKGMFTATGESIFTDTQVAALRMLIAGLVLLPFAVKGISRIQSVKDLLMLAIVGLFGSFIPAFLFTYAETGVSSGYAGMLNSFTPIFALVIGFVVFKKHLTTIQIIGVAIGTLGIVLLALAGQDLSIDGSWKHIVAIIIATFCYAISLNVIKQTLQHYKSTDITSLSFLIVLLPSIISSFYTGSIQTIQTNEFATQGLIYIALLSIVGTAFAVILFNNLITMSSVLFASSVTYLIPIVAVLIGLGFGEAINLSQIGAMLIVLTGVFVANYLGMLRGKIAGLKKS